MAARTTRAAGTTVAAIRTRHDRVRTRGPRRAGPAVTTTAALTEHRQPARVAAITTIAADTTHARRRTTSPTGATTTGPPRTIATIATGTAIGGGPAVTAVTAAAQQRQKAGLAAIATGPAGHRPATTGPAVATIAPPRQQPGIPTRATRTRLRCLKFHGQWAQTRIWVY